MSSPEHVRAVLRMRRGPRAGQQSADVPCPWCKAVAGEPCRITGSTRAAPRMHPLRAQAAGLGPRDPRTLAALAALDEIAPLETDVATAPPLCPECRVGKHHSCPGETWDNHLDEPVPCPCPSSAHGVEDGPS